MQRVTLIEKKVLGMKETDLDKIIGSKYQKRLVAYDSYEWHVAEMSPDELGVWRYAGELPLRWTNRTLSETADKVRRALHRKNGFHQKRKHVRAAQAIPGIIQTSLPLIQTNKYHFPIVFKGGTGTLARRRLKLQTVGDIDDGSMRSISLAVTGVKKIRVYFGTPR